jgi:hypothetical protein
MRNPYWRLAAIARLAIAALAALVIATPASAQFGGLKKKIKPTASQRANNEEAAAPGDQGGTIVLTPEVVDQLIIGLKAGMGEREAAADADTPYGRYKKAQAAYAQAEPKCEAGKQTFPQRAAGNQKMLDKYSALTEKMLAAQSKGDMKLMAIYQDSAMAMQDPSCLVKKPDQPDDYYDAQREIDIRAEALEAKAAGFSLRELAVVKERTLSILLGRTLEDFSPSEKAAVSARSAELKPLLGFREQPTVAKKKEPAPAPTPTTAPASPQMSAAAMSMSECMSKNAQTHQGELEALGKRAEAAQAAGDTQKLMAIADTLQQIQMAGCQGR